MYFEYCYSIRRELCNYIEASNLFRNQALSDVPSKEP